MSDVKCPYCGTEQEINHDDGYDESQEHEQACHRCDKEFKFTTSISFTYQVMCQNDDHVMVPSGDKWPHLYECERCEFTERKEPTP